MTSFLMHGLLIVGQFGFYVIIFSPFIFNVFSDIVEFNPTTLLLCFHCQGIKGKVLHLLGRSSAMQFHPSND